VKRSTPGQTRTGDTRIRNPLLLYDLAISPETAGWVSKRGVDEFIPKEDFGHTKSEIIIIKILTRKREISAQLSHLSELLA